MIAPGLVRPIRLAIKAIWHTIQNDDILLTRNGPLNLTIDERPKASWPHGRELA